MANLASIASELNPLGLVSTITQVVGEATLLVQNPQYAPIAVSLIQATVGGIVTQIPVVGGTLNSGINSVVGTLTQVIGPGETAIIPIIGSVTAIVGSITEVIPVVAATTTLSAITSSIGSIVGSVTGGIIPINTGAVTNATGITGITTPTGIITTPTGIVTPTTPINNLPTTLPTSSLLPTFFSNVADPMAFVPASPLIGMLTLWVSFMALFFGGGAAMIMI